MEASRENFKGNLLNEDLKCLIQRMENLVTFLDEILSEEHKYLGGKLSFQSKVNMFN